MRKTVTSAELWASIEQLRKKIEVMKEVMKSVGKQHAVDMTTAATLLTAPDAPPPTKEEIKVLTTLVRQEIQLLTRLLELLEKLANDDTTPES